MNRADLLKRAGLLVGGAFLGRAMPLAEAAPVVEAAPPDAIRPLICRVKVTRLDAAGALCAPLEPY